MKPSTDPSKRQKIPVGSEIPGLPPGVWIVATPIGNLSDLTLRARLALEHAEWIACEDTRRTRSLLSALSISASTEGAGDRLRRYDRHTPESVVEAWMQELRSSRKSVAVVSDAGTPGISDPGALFVRKAREAGLTITPVPGPSAVTALLSVTGWPDADAFSFQGFFPRSTKDLEDAVETAAEWTRKSARAWIAVWFESPERITTTLERISAHFVGRVGLEMTVAKELTKVHETIFQGSLDEVAGQVASEIAEEGALGEWVVAIRFPALDAVISESSEQSVGWSVVLQCLLESGAKASDAARILSQRFGVTREEAYARALDFKKNQRGG